MTISKFHSSRTKIVRSPNMESLSLAMAALASWHTRMSSDFVDMSQSDSNRVVNFCSTSPRLRRVKIDETNALGSASAICEDLGLVEPKSPQLSTVPSVRVASSSNKEIKPVLQGFRTRTTSPADFMCSSHGACIITIAFSDVTKKML